MLKNHRFSNDLEGARDDFVEQSVRKPKVFKNVFAKIGHEILTKVILVKKISTCARGGRAHVARMVLFDRDWAPSTWAIDVE